MSAQPDLTKQTIVRSASRAEAVRKRLSEMTPRSAEINGHALEEGDGAAIEGEPEVRIEGDEVLVFDMA